VESTVSHEIAGPPRPLWRRAADGVLIAAFAVLLAAALAGPLLALVRPGNATFFDADVIAQQAALAGLDYGLFYWTRLATTTLAAVVLAGAASVLFRQHRRQPAAALLAFSLLLLAITIYCAQLYGSAELSFLLGRSVSAAWALFTIAMMIFPDGRFAPAWMRWVALGFLVVALLTWLGLTLLPPAFVGVAILLIAVGGLILRYRRLPSGTERQQIRWALLGFATGAPLTILTVSLQTLVIYAEGTPPATVVWTDALVFTVLLPLSHLLIAGGMLISLLKYRLYDADRVITRSVSFSALTIILLALFTGTEKVIELLGHEWFHHELGVLAGGLGAALAAATFVPLHHRLTHWAEHRFQKELIRLRKGLPALMGDLRETAPPARIAAAALDRVAIGVRASQAALVMDGMLVDARGIAASEVEDWRAAWQPAARDGFDIDRHDPVFPLRIPLEADGHGRVGWLLLGPRPDGSFYGKDERETLAQIADPVARALEIAARREAREAAERELWRGQAKLNARLLKTLGSLDHKLGRLLPPAAEAAE